MASNRERAAILVRAIEATIKGDSTVVKNLYTEDVHGWSPALHVSSATELAVECEDRDEAFSDPELDLRPLDVGEDRACVEWTARVTHSGQLAISDAVAVEPTGARLTLHGVTIAEFEGDRIRSFRQYWDEVQLLEQLHLLPAD